MPKLTDRIVASLPVPPRGNQRYPDSELPGFNAQITAGGSRAYVLRYRARGVSRQLTIGTTAAWTVVAARNEARRLRRLIDQGRDPLAEEKAERDAPTVADLAKRYETEHLPGKRPRGAHEDRAMLRDHILPAIGKLKVSDVAQADIRKMHRGITKTGKPVRANRVLACARAMFNMSAAEWNMRADNPCKGVKPNPEDARERFLSPAEIARLSTALDNHPERNTVALVRFLMLTGARYTEAATATWGQFDLAGGTWTKPSSHTKQKRQHTVPLSAPALALLNDLLRTARGPWVFPSPETGRPLVTIKTAWKHICRDADLKGVRIHDLRHSYASVLAGAGASLQLIGSLLGHVQIATTMRYAHLADDARRAAAERAGAVIAGSGRPPAEVVPLPKRAG
jgi:integrase